MRSLAKTLHRQWTKPRRSRRWTAVRLLILLLPVLVALAIQQSTGPGTAATPAVPVPAGAMQQPSVSPPASAAPDPASIPAPAPAPAPATAGAQQLPPAAPPRQLLINGPDFSVPVLPLLPDEDDVAAQSIVPPETTDGYWLAGYGQPGSGSANTTYIAGHSWAGRDTLFNRLSSDVGVGEKVTLVTDGGTIDYVVDSVTTHDKDSLKTSDIWRIVPNRLVIISCFTEDLWGKNVIVTAMPAAAEAG